MLELSSSGSVRGVPSNGHPYRDPRLTDVQPPALSRQSRLNQSIIAERLILSYLSGMLLSNPPLDGSDRCAFVLSEILDPGGQVSQANSQISVVDDDESMREAMRGLMGRWDIQPKPSRQLKSS